MQRFNYPTRTARHSYTIYNSEEAALMREWTTNDGTTTIEAATEREAIVQMCVNLENYLVASGSSSEKINRAEYAGALKAVRHILKQIANLQEI